MKSAGTHWSALLQLVRRGGLSGRPIIDPDKSDGEVQAIRARNTTN